MPEINSNIGYINSFFGKYNLRGLDDILKLRLEEINFENVKILQNTFVHERHNNVLDLIFQILTSSENKILVPINLYNKHAVGLIFERNEYNFYSIKYIDPLNKSIPQELLKIIQNILPNSQYKQIVVEQQKYANCGPDVIENFILYLTGNRVPQEKAIEFHSKLLENSLLDLSVPNDYLLFEKLDYYGYQPDIYLSGNYDQET